jgi:alpha-1,3-rhamnosyl/mannosyltransferase
VVINRLSGSGSKTGVGHYTAELTRGLAALAAPGERIDGFPQGWVRRAHAAAGRLRPWLEPRRPRQLTAGPPGPPTWRGRLIGMLRRWGRAVLQRHFDALCARERFDLYHEPNFVPLPTDVPTVITVHDLSVLLHPEWHPADRVAHFEEGFRRGLAQCRHVLTVSEHARREIIATLGLPPDRVTATPNGTRADLGPLPPEEVAAGLRRLGLPPRYLLFVGTLEPRKNVLTLLRAYVGLPAAVRARYPLLLVGAWGWNTAELAAYYEDEARHRGVVHAGYVSDDRLPLLYNGARALVFPSFYEGFGLPPVEMQACGGAVLASTAGAVAETAGRCAHLIDPHDTDGWRDAMLRVATDDDWWAGLRRGAAGSVRGYTWERCAALTLDVYRRVCGLSAAPRLAG